jgi:hypothetical protein
MSFQRVALLAACAVLGLGGCGASGSGESGSGGDAAATSSGGSVGASCPITAKDTWAKAADSGSTAVFGELVNNGKQAVTVAAATSTAAARVEIHEVVDRDGSMVMQPKPGGLVIAAGASAVLAPGGDHLMLMELSEPLKAGNTVTVTLRCADGATAELTAQVKTFTGASEQYQPSPAGSGSPMGEEPMPSGKTMGPNTTMPGGTGMDSASPSAS